MKPTSAVSLSIFLSLCGPATVFRWLNSTTRAGYENWYPFDMSYSAAMYISSGGFMCHTSSLPATLNHAIFRLTVEME